MALRTSRKLPGAPAPPAFVAYYRVSTDQQGVSGLGLEAQREAVARYVASVRGHLVEEFEEVESGKKNNRPQLAAALAACRLRRAILVIAKLDRLARNVAFISHLMDAGVEFVACDNPNATRLTIHVLAAVAEHEREMISQRTKAALAVVKAAIARDGGWTARRSGRRITSLGGPNLIPGAGARAGAYRARRAKSKIADERANDVRPYLDAALTAGCNSLRELARALNARGIPAPRGGEWTATQVSRAMARSEAREAER